LLVQDRSGGATVDEEGYCCFAVGL
jgi:hypothetical protein